jgi:hypothetical protein
MTISKPWTIGIATVVFALIALGTYEWLQEHNAQRKTTAQTATQQKTIDQAKADAVTVQSNLAAQLKTLEAQRQQPATAQRIVTETSKLIPNLPKPIEIQTVTKPATTSGDGKQTDAPAQQIVIPSEDFSAVQKAEIDCQEDAAKLDACTKTAADTATELKATTAQRDEWKQTAKGGTWWHRTVTAAKWVGIGAVAGAAAGYAAHR